MPAANVVYAESGVCNLEIVFSTNNPNLTLAGTRVVIRNLSTNSVVPCYIGNDKIVRIKLEYGLYEVYANEKYFQVTAKSNFTRVELVI